MRANIFQIQRFCLDDGDGIRTTVFWKGCPLSCLWCHNPEGKREESILSFQTERCLQCRKCEAVCPEGVHFWKDGAHNVRYEKCIRCGRCVQRCPKKCLEIIGREMETEELAEELLKEQAFWSGGGGVTFSGGEPLSQPDAVWETGKILKRKNCNVMIETSGYAGRAAVEKVMQVADGWLYDFKAGPADKHRRLCGQGNELIQDNFRFLYRAGARLVVRYPLVPGLNDGTEDFVGLYRLLRETSLEIPVQIMPYHILGKGKAERTGQVYPECLPKKDADADYVRQKKEELMKMGIFVR